MAKSKKSASQIAAEIEYFKKHNISFEVKDQKGIKKASKVSFISAPNPNGQPFGLTSIKDFIIYMATINNIIPQVQFSSDKEVVEKIYEHYNGVLIFIKGPYSYKEAVVIKEYIKENNCHQGICYYARKVHGWRISETWWVKQFSEYGFWYEMPKYVFTVKDLIKTIEYRVERLKEILKSIIDNDS